MSASILETNATSMLHAISAVGLGTVIDLIFPPPPGSDAQTGGPISEVKEALLLLLQFNVGLIAGRNLLEHLLPNSEAYNSPIGDGLFHAFFWPIQRGMWARLFRVLDVVVDKTLQGPLALGADAPETTDPSVRPSPTGADPAVSQDTARRQPLRRRRPTAIGANPRP
jgi:hypothetical protein